MEEIAFLDFGMRQKNYSINYRELLAVKLGLFGLADDIEESQILLRIDNMTAISYINRMGDIRLQNYNSLAREISQWAENKKNFLYASYIPSTENIRADKLTRLKNDDAEWELGQIYFNKVVENFRKTECRFICNQNNAKCKKFFSWMPDKKPQKVDAFTVNWEKLDFYAFPPFNMILKALVKINKENAAGIFVVPYWPNQPWYSLFWSLLDDKPLILGPDNDMLISPCRSRTHPQAAHLGLIVGRLSSKLF